MKKRTIFAIYLLSIVFVSSAYAGWFSSDGDNTYIRTTVTSGSGLGQIYPAKCTRVTVEGGRTDKVQLEIPRPVTYSTDAPIVWGTTRTYPLSSTILRYYYGGLRVELDAAPGAGNSIRVELEAKCLSQTSGALNTADVTIGGDTKTFNQSAEYTCQDRSFPSPVTLQWTSSASLTSTIADICFDTFKVIDPCPAASVSAETRAACAAY
jgi:hypothetical protein